MTWHNLSWILAQRKSKANLPWQVQLSWRDPTGISNTLTSQIKPSAWRMCPPRVRKKIIKNTDGLSACRKADVDCILMADIFGEVLRLTLSPAPRGENKKSTHRKEDNEKQRKSLSKNMKRSNSHCASSWGEVLRDDDYIEWSCYLFIAKLRQQTFSCTPHHSRYLAAPHLNSASFKFSSVLHSVSTYN